jgi:hypothetical protein
VPRRSNQRRLVNAGRSHPALLNDWTDFRHLLSADYVDIALMRRADSFPALWLTDWLDAPQVVPPFRSPALRDGPLLQLAIGTPLAQAPTTLSQPARAFELAAGNFFPWDVHRSDLGVVSIFRPRPARRTE